MKERFALMLLILALLPWGGIALGEGEVILEDENMTWVELEDVPDEALSLQYGDERDEVKRLQEKLKNLGYYNGNLSGRYREGTRAAIEAFQGDYGLEITGVADPETQAAVYQARYRALERGDSGEDVKWIQSRLTALGYYHGKLSGNYLEGTTSAIKSFQKRNGLEDTGKADIATQQALEGDDAIAKDAATPTPTPNLTFTQAGAVAAQPQKYTKKLTRGSTGKSVKLLQQRLTDLGFYTGPISGNYMNQTQAAIKRFQEYNGLEADGVTGEKTWDALFNADEVVPAGATPRPTPVPTPVPYALTVDVNNQVVKVYGLDDNNQHTRLVRQMICSTGTKNNPSDVGDWTLSGRTARWCYFPKWGSHAQYWTKINSSIAFHSVIYNSVDTMDLSVKSYNALGKRASHGCIRLLVSDAKWIYANVGKGTVVTITEDLPSDPELTQALQPPALNRSNMLPVETPQPTAAPVLDGTEAYAFSRTLSKGSEGEDVFWLQTALKRLGYYEGSVTGGYYSGTQEAVKAFQQANGLKADGAAGRQTWAALQAVVSPTPTPVPTAGVIATPAPVKTAAPLGETPQPTGTAAPLAQG